MLKWNAFKKIVNLDLDTFHALERFFSGVQELQIERQGKQYKRIIWLISQHLNNKMIIHNRKMKVSIVNMHYLVKEPLDKIFFGQSVERSYSACKQQLHAEQEGKSVIFID